MHGTHSTTGDFCWNTSSRGSDSTDSTASVTFDCDLKHYSIDYPSEPTDEPDYDEEVVEELCAWAVTLRSYDPALFDARLPRPSPLNDLPIPLYGAPPKPREGGIGCRNFRKEKAC